jgi:hypothetical protein
MFFHDHHVQRLLAAERSAELRHDARRSTRRGRLGIAVAGAVAVATAVAARAPRLGLHRRPRLDT